MAQKWRSTRRVHKNATSNKSTEARTDQPARRPVAPLDGGRLERMALNYVARYATTSSKLNHYLARKIAEALRLGMIDGGEADALSQRGSEIVARCAELGYVNDDAWAKGKASTLRARGYGDRRIRETLRAAGLDTEIIDTLLAENGDDGSHDHAFQSALRFARQRKIGPFASAEPDKRAVSKNVVKLVRAGHPYDIACKIASMRVADIDVDS